MCYRLQPLILDMTVVYFFQGQMGENRKQIQNNMQKLDNITIKRTTAAAQTPFTVLLRMDIKRTSYINRDFLKKKRRRYK